VEHAQVVDTADLKRFGRHGIIASMQPVHQTSDMHMAEARMGLPRLGGAYAWKSMLANNSRLAFGSDYPVESPNPFHGLAVAVSRQDAQGKPPRGWLAKEKLTMEQALAAFTSDAAYAGFAEKQIGRLAPGMAADFILLDRDIMRERDQRRVRGTQVLETWVGGEQVWAREAATR
jgi:predicted amidohydrolase YtcJ